MFGSTNIEKEILIIIIVQLTLNLKSVAERKGFLKGFRLLLPAVKFDTFKVSKNCPLCLPVELQQML